MRGRAGQAPAVATGCHGHAGKEKGVSQLTPRLRPRGHPRGSTAANYLAVEVDGAAGAAGATVTGATA
jgi:hypothetical protein